MFTPSPLRRPLTSWFDDEDAPGARDLHTCIHCGLCLTACPTYRVLKIEPDSPRGRLYLMRGLAEGRIAPSEELQGHLDLCLGCRACETVCPAGVPYGRLLEETRGQLARRAPRSSPTRVLGRWALDGLLPHRDLMHLAADVLRLGQSGPGGAAVSAARARGWLPGFAARGLDMTPPIPPRAERRLESLESRLPPGAVMQRTDEGLIFRPAGPPRARVAFFASCVMEVMFPRTSQESVRLMVLAGAEVVVPRSQTCCGALHAHAGLRRTAKRLARTNVAAFAGVLAGEAAAERDFVVTDSAGCGAALREAGHLLDHDPLAEEARRFSANVRDVSQVLAALSFPTPGVMLSSPRDPSRPLRVAYHDPCHLAHAQRVRSEPRSLLSRLRGVELSDLPDPDWCCGSAGVYNLTHADMADTQLERKLDGIASQDPDVVVASNPGCLLHMARGARERGLAARMVHLVEVLGMAHPAPPVGMSAR